MKKVLLLGGNGVLGSALKLQMREEFDIQLYSPGSLVLDVLDLEALQNFCQATKPDIIINTVAYTQVDQAETDKERCYALNVTAIENLIELEVPVVHFSTDYVFGDTTFAPIQENETVAPLNYYGTTKAEAETKLLKAKTPVWIIRTNWLFGLEGLNFIETMLRFGKEKKQLSVINDQIGRPTYAVDLAKAVTKYFILDSQREGLYHLQNTGLPVSWYGLVQHVWEQFPHKRLAKLEAITSEAWNASAQRPKNSVLQNTKLPANVMKPWPEAVSEYLSTLKE